LSAGRGAAATTEIYTQKGCLCSPSLISVPAEFITVGVFDADFHSTPVSIFVVAAFLAIHPAIFGAAVYLIVVATPISAHSAMIFVLIHPAVHLLLAHPVVIYTFITSLPRGPVLIEPGVLSVSIILPARLVRLLWCSLWQNRSILVLNLVFIRLHLWLLGKGRKG
jgi:hypothetical protein